jgi:hypothetical protein
LDRQDVSSLDALQMVVLSINCLLITQLLAKVRVRIRVRIRVRKRVRIRVRVRVRVSR